MRPPQAGGRGPGKKWAWLVQGCGKTLQPEQECIHKDSEAFLVVPGHGGGESVQMWERELTKKISDPWAATVSLSG